MAPLSCPLCSQHVSSSAIAPTTLSTYSSGLRVGLGRSASCCHPCPSHSCPALAEAAGRDHAGSYSLSLPLPLGCQGAPEVGNGQGGGIYSLLPPPLCLLRPTSCSSAGAEQQKLWSSYLPTGRPGKATAAGGSGGGRDRKGGEGPLHTESKRGGAESRGGVFTCFWDFKSPAATRAI